MDFAAYLDSLRTYFQRKSSDQASAPGDRSISKFNEDVSVWRKYPSLSREIYQNVCDASSDQIQQNIHLLLPPFLNMLDDVTPIATMLNQPYLNGQVVPYTPAMYATLILTELLKKCPPSFLKSIGLWENVVVKWTCQRATALLLFSAAQGKTDAEMEIEARMTNIVTTCWLEVVRASILLEGPCDQIRTDKFGIVLESTTEKAVISWISCMDMNAPVHVRQIYAQKFVLLLRAISKLVLKHAKKIVSVVLQYLQFNDTSIQLSSLDSLDVILGQCSERLLHYRSEIFATLVDVFLAHVNQKSLSDKLHRKLFASMTQLYTQTQSDEKWPYEIKFVSKLHPAFIELLK